jgi:hypothetical protein
MGVILLSHFTLTPGLILWRGARAEESFSVSSLVWQKMRFLITSPVGHEKYNQQKLIRSSVAFLSAHSILRLLKLKGREAQLVYLTKHGTCHLLSSLATTNQATTHLEREIPPPPHYRHFTAPTAHSSPTTHLDEHHDSGSSPREVPRRVLVLKSAC